jgi:hypothetical protein
MKADRVLWIQFVILILAGLATWWVFTKGEQETGGQVILDARADQVERLEYTTASREIVAQAIDQGQAFHLTVRENLSPRKTAEPAPGAADSPAPAAGDAGQTQKTTRYRASPDFTKSLERVLPLVALRELGVVDQARRKEFGLDAPEASLRVVSRGQTVEFQVGKRTYGRSSVYLGLGADGPVSLVSSGLLSIVDFKPPRYKELRFLGLASKDVEQVFLDCGVSGRRTLVHQDRFQAKGDNWAPSDAPETEDALYGNWMAKLIKLGLVQYSDEPFEPSPESSCKLVFQVEGRGSVHAQLAWSDDATGKRSYRGRSDFSRDWVELDPTAAGSLVSDLNAVVSTEGSRSP